MKVVCLIPSWTETLLEAGVEVIGRTRYCIHPAGLVQNIPIVGGTKDADWVAIENLQPDFVVMDKEENTIDMANLCPCPTIITHVTSLESLKTELFKVAQKLQSAALMNLKTRLDKILATKPPPWNWEKVPGAMQPLSKALPAQKVFYVIWRKPWMCVGPETFIFSVLQFLGAPMSAWDEKKYPKIKILPTEPENFYLFSTEPYPFAVKIEEVRGFHGVIVDGENYSWFGHRSIRFLEKTLGISNPG